MVLLEFGRALLPRVGCGAILSRFRQRQEQHHQESAFHVGLWLRSNSPCREMERGTPDWKQTRVYTPRWGDGLAEEVFGDKCLLYIKYSVISVFFSSIYLPVYSLQSHLSRAIGFSLDEVQLIHLSCTDQPLIPKSSFSSTLCHQDVSGFLRRFSFFYIYNYHPYWVNFYKRWEVQAESWFFS